MERFNGKTVVVTGGSSGIGHAIAQRIAREGGKLVLISRNADQLAGATASLEGEGHVFKPCDVTQPLQLAEVFKEFAAQQVRLYSLICCAGAHAVRPAALSKPEDYLQLMTANF